jgi:hypothetical protein
MTRGKLAHTGRVGANEKTYGGVYTIGADNEAYTDGDTEYILELALHST